MAVPAGHKALAAAIGPPDETGPARTMHTDTIREASREQHQTTSHMKPRPASVEEAIRIEAYILSEKAGHPSGMEHAFWQQAETIIHSRLTAGSPARARKPAAPSAAASRRKPAVAPPKSAANARKSSPGAKAAADVLTPAVEAKAEAKPAPKPQPAKRPPSPRKTKS